MLATTIKSQCRSERTVRVWGVLCYPKCLSFSCLSLSEEFCTVEIAPFSFFGSESGGERGVKNKHTLI